MKDLTNSDDKIFFSTSVTINIGNFESVKIDAGYSSSLLAGETPDEAQERVEGQVIGMLTNRIAKIRTNVQQLIS